MSLYYMLHPTRASHFSQLAGSCCWSSAQLNDRVTLELSSWAPASKRTLSLYLSPPFCISAPGAAKPAFFLTSSLHPCGFGSQPCIEFRGYPWGRGSTQSHAKPGAALGCLQWHGAMASCIAAIACGKEALFACSQQNRRGLVLSFSSFVRSF